MSGYDAIVIGGGSAGLTAAAYLARAGRRVVLLEESDTLGGLCRNAPLGDGVQIPHAAHLLYALDPRVVKDLKLSRLGLKFAVRDLPLVTLRHDGKHLQLSRSVHDSARSIALQSRADAEAWPRFRRELFALARALRPLWWNGTQARLGHEQQAMLDRLSRASAVAWLDTWFESDVLKSALAFDAAAGLAPAEPGSALVLLWRAAQEMCGLQGAVAFARGGPAALSEALALAARRAGADLRTRARVTTLFVANGAVTGVALENETLTAPLVFSTLPVTETFALADFAAAGLAQTQTLARDGVRTGEAMVTFALSELPALAGVAVPLASRFLFAERESLAAAHLSAATGQLPHEIAFEMILPSALDPSLAPQGRHLVSALVRPVPLAPRGGWPQRKAELAARVGAMLDRHWPDLGRSILAADILTPDQLPRPQPASVPRLLSDARERCQTPITGLVLCGGEAEPMASVSGRAARLAVAEMLERRP
jgi:phytoene dehydrogenase-like protein